MNAELKKRALAVGLRVLKEEAAKQEELKKQKALIRKILESDRALERWIDKYAEPYGVMRPPICRASVYGNEPHHWEGSREIHWHPFSSSLMTGRDPRRPVFMKGALEVLIRKNALFGGYSANGYALKILDRYLKIKKFTCFDRKEEWDFITTVARKLREKFSLSYHFDNHVWGGIICESSWPTPGGEELETRRAWVGGEQVRLSRNQFEYIQTLDRIRKTYKTRAQRALALRAYRLDQITDGVRPQPDAHQIPESKPPIQPKMSTQRKKKLMLEMATKLLEVHNVSLEGVFEDAKRAHKLA